jgi:pimeloyl-ACP methyl ester carboxylesterase
VRLHLAEAGQGPLVLLLHGFPQYWWAWRAQLPALADAGFRAVAPDLRGYGASDKPPRGYDLPTAAGDVAALVRALGERDAVVVGHDWGGLVAWTMAALHPRVVRRLVVVSMAHPRLMRAGLRDPAQRRALRHVLGFQLPRLPERRLTRADDDPVADFLRRWAGPGWTRPPTSPRRWSATARPRASRRPRTGRWSTSAGPGRSQLRPDGLRYARRMAAPVTAPTLQLHGALDTLRAAAHRAGVGPLRGRAPTSGGSCRLGHFPPEEAPPTSPPPSPTGPGDCANGPAAAGPPLLAGAGVGPVVAPAPACAAVPPAAP